MIGKGAMGAFRGRFTLLFAALAMALIEREMPVNKVGQLLGENTHRIWTIFNHCHHSLNAFSLSSRCSKRVNATGL